MKNSIKVERARKDMSQEDLAKLVNVSRQTIHSVERGKKIPSVELALKIANAFQVTVESIFEIDTKM